MVASHIVRRYLFSRGVVVLFGLQLAFLLATFVEPHSIGIVAAPVLTEATLINGFTDLLFAPGYTGLWDPLATLLVLPVVYYASAIVVSSLGRAVAQWGRRLSR